MSLPGVGMSVMEISHRSKTFEDILNKAIADIRELAAVPSNYKILMLQGGASLQFSMVSNECADCRNGSRLYRHRIVGEESHQGSRTVGTV